MTKIFAICNEKHLTLSDHNSGVNNNRKQWILTAADAGVGRIHCLKGGEYELNQYQEVQDKLLNIFVFNAKQDGPSLESSSYLNVSLRCPGP